MKQKCGEALGDLESVHDPFPIMSDFTLLETVPQTGSIFVEQNPYRLRHFLTVNHRGPLQVR